jgi:hypothetical protein
LTLGLAAGGNQPRLQAPVSRGEDLVGGEGALAARLGVDKNELDLWIRNFVRPPSDAFLKAADIVGEHELSLLKEQPNAPPSAALSGGGD